MAYNDNQVAINPDGDGNSVFYSDQNPTINGQYIGGGYTFGSDASQNGHATAQIIWGRHHVASANGYYIMNDDRMLNTSDTFTTLNVIDSNGSISNHITTTGTILQGKDGAGATIPFIRKTTSSGGLRFGADDSLILGAGEFGALIQNTITLGDESVHIGGEQGVYFYSSPDNLTSGWAGKYSMRFNESGRLGIRTESPTSTLHILGENDNQVKIDVAAGSSFSSLAFARNGTNSAVVAYNHNINQFQLYSSCTCAYISMYTGGSEKATLAKDGRLGIGALVPTLSQDGQGLHICSSNPAIRLDVGATGWGYLEFYRGATAKYIQGYRDANGFYRIAPGSSLSTCAGITINPDGYIGVGVCETPKQQLEVHGNILLGANDVSSVLHGGGNIAMSSDANLLFVADSNTTSDSPDSDIIFGGGSSVNTDANRGFGFNDAYPSSVPRCEWMRIRFDGKIGVGTASPSYKLHVNGTFYSAGSSCEYKTQICQYNTDSCMFMKLTPVTYQYKDEWCHLGKELKSGTQIGLIAEDVAQVYPELAILKDEEDNKVVRNVDYEKLSIILLSELQKLRAEVDELKSK